MERQVYNSIAPSITVENMNFSLSRWLIACELHYSPLQEIIILDGLWNKIPTLYLPTKILRVWFEVMPDPLLNVKKLIALLA